MGAERGALLHSPGVHTPKGATVMVGKPKTWAEQERG